MMDINVKSHEATSPTALSAALKQATAELHTRAEKHPSQAKLLTGRATSDEYAAFLAQMAALHYCLEAALRGLSEVSAVAGVVRPYHFREAAASADLAALGYPASMVTPLAATLCFCERLQAMLEGDPVSLLGVLYVLEGATNGGRFIAAAVRPSLSLPEGIGTAYLDPHGSLQHERWAQFKTSVDELELSPAQRSAVITAARETFNAVYDILEGLNSPSYSQPYGPASSNKTLGATNECMMP